MNCRIFVLWIAMSWLLTGCAGHDRPLLAQVPVHTETVAAEYRKLAECIYEFIRRDSAGALKKTDLPESKIIRIARDTGGVIYWELELKADGPARTKLSLSGVNTIWGPAGRARKDVLPAIRACAGSS